MTSPGDSDPVQTSTVPGRERQQASRRRTMLYALTAMLVGYLAASRGQTLWRDRHGVSHEFLVMNTYGRIVIPAGRSLSASPADLAATAETAVRQINDLMSPFGEDSDIRRLNASRPEGWTAVHPSTWRVVMEALRWHRLSGGAFDPTIGPVKRLFTFDRSETGQWPAEDDLAAAKIAVGGAHIRYRREGMQLSFSRPGMVLDLGAIAKGYGADRAAEVLIANGVKNALVDIGGELRVLGNREDGGPWQTGIRHPRTGEVMQVLELSGAAVATSGDYESYFIRDGVRYEHIIDPRTGEPVSNGVASVTVIHPVSCMAADALATTLCVLGREEGEAFLRSQNLWLFGDGLRVIMVVDTGAGLEKTEFTLDGKGGFEAVTETLE